MPFTRTLAPVPQIAATLTPDQRAVLLQVGIPAWCGLALPYFPYSDFERDVLHALIALELVQPTSQGPRGYRLTTLGLQVAACGLSSIFQGVRA